MDRRHLTWNPWVGCRKLSPGCAKCYAERDMTRFGRDFRVVQRSKTTFRDPLRWKKERLKVFVNSWSDFFIQDADEWRPEAWDIIEDTPHLTYLILTKRPDQIEDRLPSNWGPRGWPNVWLGTSVETQAYAQRIDALLRYPARVHFVSAEPLLGPLDLSGYMIPAPELPGGRIDWVITGAESGPEHRETKVSWIRALRDQCQAKGVPFFLKQMYSGNHLYHTPNLDGIGHTASPEVSDAHVAPDNPRLFD